MGLREKLDNYFKRKAETKMQARLGTVKEVYDEIDTREIGIKEAAKRAIQEIEDHPDMSAVDFLKMIQEADELPDAVVAEVAKKIPEIKPEEVAVQVVKELDLQSQDIKKIIKNPEVSLDAAIEMANHIPDEAAKVEEEKRLAGIRRRRREEQRRQAEIRDAKELKDKYVHCNEIHITTLVNELKSIRERTDLAEVDEMIQRILARQAAIEWKRVGSARITSMEAVLPVDQMIECDFAGQVEREFEEVKGMKQYRGERGYDKQKLQQMILSELAKKVVKSYGQVGILDIPQVEGMRNLTSEQEEEFIRQIQIYDTEGSIDVEKVHKKIRGIKGDELEDLKAMLEKVPEEKDDYIKEFKRQVREGRVLRLDPEVEKRITRIREELQGVKKGQAVDILEETIESIEEAKQANVDIPKSNGTGRKEDEVR